MERWIALVFMFFVLLNEFLLRFFPGTGVFMYLVLISLAFILLSKNEGISNSEKMVVIFLALPFIRIANLFFEVSYIWKVFLGGVILIFLSMYYLFQFDIHLGNLYRNLWVVPLSILFGILLGLVGNGLFGDGGNLALIMVLPFVVFGEELFFRGLMQNTIRTSCGVFYSIVIPALIYSGLSLHLGVGLAVLFLFVGLVSGMFYSLTKNIFVSIAFNLTVSILVFVVSGLM